MRLIPIFNLCNALTSASVYSEWASHTMRTLSTAEQTWDITHSQLQKKQVILPVANICHISILMQPWNRILTQTVRQDTPTFGHIWCSRADSMFGLWFSTMGEMGGRDWKRWMSSYVMHNCSFCRMFNLWLWNEEKTSGCYTITLEFQHWSDCTKVSKVFPFRSISVVF